MKWNKTGTQPWAVNLLAFGSHKGEEKVIRARYICENCLVCEGNDEHNVSVYNEEKDEYYYQEGWYETNEFEDIHWKVEFEVTHWMSLPKPPDSDSWEALCADAIAEVEGLWPPDSEYDDTRQLGRQIMRSVVSNETTPFYNWRDLEPLNLIRLAVGNLREEGETELANELSARAEKLRTDG